MNWLSTSDHERLSRFAAFGVSALAAAACLYLLVAIGWRLVPRSRPAGAGAATAAPPAPPAALSIAKWHLFGNPQALAPAAGPALASVLKLGLRGTLALPDASDARALAIIVNEQGVETSYRVGVEVAPGAKLAAVYADHVVLDHAGVAETLTLPRPEQHAPPLPEKNQQRLGAANPAASATAGRPAATASAPLPGIRPPPALDAQEFARQIRPVVANGRVVGADISGADAGLLARVGLKPSDVVTAVNGTPLADMSNPQALLEQLQNNPSIQVTVQRDGKPATLTLSLR